MKFKNLLHVFVILIIFHPGIIYSQDEGTQISVASYRKIYSKVLKEERTVAVSLPVNYEASGKRYPVLYILDGEDSDFISFIGVARFLSPQRIPEMIIVGVININRNRDLFSYKVEGLNKTKEDGAINFLNFLSDELIPFIDKNYRTTPHRTIYGQSAGGHFVTFVLLTDPDIFEAYLASSPVIGYSDNIMLKKAEAFFNNHKSLYKSYFVYYGKTDYYSVVKRIPLLESIISKNTPAGFKWGIKAVEGRHVPWESFYELVLMVYSDWNPVNRPVINPSKGELLRGQTIPVQISRGQDPVHYTINGEEPSGNSPVYKGPVQINRTTTLKAKAIRTDLQESSTAEAQFTIVNNYRPSRKVTGLKNGLKYKYIEQQIFDLPDRITGIPTKSGVIPAINIGISDRNQVNVIEYDGFIKVPANGKFRFTLFTTSAKLFIDDELIIYSVSLLPKETAWEMCLESGYHSIRIVTDMFLKPSHVLELYWESPGIRKQIIPAHVFYHK